MGILAFAFSCWGFFPNHRVRPSEPVAAGGVGCGGSARRPLPAFDAGRAPGVRAEGQTGGSVSSRALARRSLAHRGADPWRGLRRSAYWEFRLGNVRLNARKIGQAANAKPILRNNLRSLARTTSRSIQAKSKPYKGEKWLVNVTVRPSGRFPRCSVRRFGLSHMAQMVSFSVGHGVADT